MNDIIRIKRTLRLIDAARLIGTATWLGLATTAAILAFGRPTRAHDAPTGWSYPYSCCSSADCRQVADRSVLETKGGYLASNGETIPYADTRIRPSPDGRYHLCTVAGKDDTRTICLFVPPRAF